MGDNTIFVSTIALLGKHRMSEVAEMLLLLLQFSERMMPI